MFVYLIILLYAFPSFADDCGQPFKTKNTEALVIGTGPFGLGFSQVISENFKTVIAFGRNQETARHLQNAKLSERQTDRLPGVILSPNIHPSLNLTLSSNKKIDLFILALPVSKIADFIEKNTPLLYKLSENNPDMGVLSLSKGFYSDKGNISVH